MSTREVVRYGCGCPASFTEKLTRSGRKWQVFPAACPEHGERVTPSTAPETEVGDGD